MASSGQSAWNRNDPLTEGVVFEKRLADDIGQKWKDLGRALGFHQASIENIEQEKGNNPKECCIAVLVRWLRRDGKEGATAGNLAEALTKIGLKNLADRFPIKPSDTNRNAKEDRKARELEDTVSKMKNKNKELEEEVSKMKNKNKELEEEVSRLRAINKELQDGEKQEVEVSKLRAINKESQDGEKQEVEVSKIKELEEEVSKIKELEEEPPFVVTQK
ncbi:putative uncharacterized protein DDB_G0271982 isoform X3 [Montipora capricornis]|uniref:putative uncharacterized protein DDB_G0271982 isoform X3 n=1 Tax=Montipora capricornis TaxID=246305 RepID=UPI0035F150E9